MKASPVWFEEVSSGLIHLWLHEPGMRNAMTWRMAEKMPEVLEKIEERKPHLVVIRGMEGCFSAGGDFAFLKARLSCEVNENVRTMLQYYRSFLKIRELSSMTVAVMENAAIGAGLCFALACDERIVTSDCRIALNFLKLGISPGMGAWPLASRVLPPQIARSLLQSGRRVLGCDFFEWGGARFLVQSDEEIEVALRELESEVKGVSPLAMRSMKREAELGLNLEDHLIFEAEAQASCFASTEFRQKMDELS